MTESFNKYLVVTYLVYWASLVAQLVQNPPAMWETWVRSWVGKIPWRRKRLPTPVFWPGEFHGQYSPWGRKESDLTEQLSLSLYLVYVWYLISLSAEDTEMSKTFTNSCLHEL